MFLFVSRPPKIIDGVQCPECNEESFVIDSRDVEMARRRRRQCKNCGHRYTTYEVHADEYLKETFKVNTTQLDLVIATLRAIKVQFGDTNGGHGKN